MNHDLGTTADAVPTQPVAKPYRVGQGAARLRRDRIGQVAVDVRIEGARYMGRGMCAFAALRVNQIETAVEHAPRRVVQSGSQGLAVDQGTPGFMACVVRWSISF